jgi:hypothetical protein
MRLITVLTPITNTGRVLSPRIKHGTDNQKSRRDGTFTDSENETSGEETGKAFASRMATQSNTPDEYVQARYTSPQKIELHRKCAANVIHFPTGNLCSAKFCGNREARYPRAKIVPNLIHVSEIRTHWRLERNDATNCIYRPILSANTLQYIRK